MSKPFRDAAPALFQRGWVPLPLCRPDLKPGHDPRCGCSGRKTPHVGKEIGKSPAVRFAPYQRDQLLDPGTLAEWCRRFPDYNVGVLIEPSDLLVIDLDSPEAIKEAGACGVPDTPWQSTSEGRKQLFFRRPPDCPTLRVIGWGVSGKIDLLASGYTVVAPSLHRSGARYAGQHGPLADAPTWAVDAIKAHAAERDNQRRVAAAMLQAAAKMYPDARGERAEFESALYALDPSMSYDIWWRVQAMVHDYDDTSWGERLFALWSSASEKFDAADCARRWSRLIKGKGQTYLGVYRLAYDEGWSVPDHLRKLYAAEIGMMFEARFDVAAAGDPGAPPQHFIEASDQLDQLDQAQANASARNSGGTPPGAPPRPPGGSGGSGGDGGDKTHPFDRLGKLEFDDPEGWTYHFGRECWRERPETKWATEIASDGSKTRVQKTTIKMEFFAKGLRPISVGQNTDTDTKDHGVRFAYLDSFGRMHHGWLGGASWTSSKGAAPGALDLANQGVQIYPREGPTAVFALGSFAIAANGGRFGRPKNIASRPGWHDGVYVNGPNAYGDHSREWLWTGDNIRATRGGSLAGWIDGFNELVTTPALRLAVAASLAGALIEPLGLESIIIHFAGGSSTGKSTATRVGASIWYDWRKGASSYHDTPLAIMRRFGDFSGAVAVLDELKGIKPDDASTIVHTFANGGERYRMTQDAKIRKGRATWHAVALSSGETTLADYLGNSAQGGQLVRMLDVVLKPDEATRDAAHAAKLDAWMAAHFGHVGDAWARHLATGGKGLMEQAKGMLAQAQAWLAGKGYAETPEAARICKHLSALYVALTLSTSFDLTPLTSGDIDGVIEWAAKKIQVDRDIASTPEGRAWQILCKIRASEPYRFPTENAYKSTRMPVVGIVGPVAGDDNAALKAAECDPEDLIYTSKAMLDGCPELKEAACSSRLLIKWLEAKGIATRPKNDRLRIGKQRLRWVRLNMAMNE